MGWITPITDRKQTDVDKVEEYDQLGYIYLTEEQKREWMQGMIGALNATDLNRIESNSQFMLNALSGDYHLDFKTNWVMTDFVTSEDEKRILSNLETIMISFDLDKTIELPKIPLNYYEKINAIENILLQMYNKYFSNIEYFEFQTNSDEEFLVGDEKFIVNDSKLRKKFETNQGETFKASNNDEFVVFN